MDKKNSNFVPCPSRNVYKKTKVDKLKLIHKRQLIKLEELLFRLAGSH